MFNRTNLKAGQLVKPRFNRSCWSCMSGIHETERRSIDPAEIGLVVKVTSQDAVNEQGDWRRDRQAVLVLFGEKIEMVFSEALEAL